MDSRTFVEKYEQGNKTLDGLLKSTGSEIVRDVDFIKDVSGNDSLKLQLAQIKTILGEEQKTSYEKVIGLGNVLTGVSSEILRSDDSKIKNKGIDILSNYLGLLKDSHDSRLLSFADQMMKNINSAI